jgi:hypothetical protein
MIELVDREGAEGKQRGTSPSTKTLKMEVEAKKGQAPAAAAIGMDTRLPVSLKFECSAATSRLTDPTRRDRALLTRAPRPVGFWRRMRRDSGVRWAFVAVFIAALAGATIAFA